MSRWVVASIWAVVGNGVVGSGCGGGGGSAPPNCGREQPCGGDIVGSWAFAGACVNVTAESQELAAGCPGASIGNVGVSLTGSLAFNADMTYTASNWHETFNFTETIPLSCAGGTGCSDLNQNVTDNSNGGTRSVHATCTGTTTCVCRFSGAMALASEISTYTITGTTIDMAGAATSMSTPYCVEQDRLHLIELSTTMTGAAGQALILSDIVAQKQ